MAKYGCCHEVASAPRGRLRWKWTRLLTTCFHLTCIRRHLSTTANGNRRLRTQTLSRPKLKQISPRRGESALLSSCLLGVSEHQGAPIPQTTLTTLMSLLVWFGVSLLVWFGVSLLVWFGVSLLVWFGVSLLVWFLRSLLVWFGARRGLPSMETPTRPGVVQ